MAAAARQALDRATATRALERAYEAQRDGSRGAALASAAAPAADLMALDTAVDGVLTRMYKKLEADVLFWGPDSAEGGAAARLIDACFPQGLGELTKAPWLEQAGENRRVADLLTAPEWESDVRATGLGAALSPLLTAVEAFDKAFRARSSAPAPAVSWGDVRAAQAACHEELHELCATLTHETRGDAAARSTLLGGFLQRWAQSKRTVSRATEPDTDESPPTAG
jgi:hypothetical protein